MHILGVADKIQLGQARRNRMTERVTDPCWKGRHTAHRTIAVRTARPRRGGREDGRANPYLRSLGVKP